MKTRSRSTRVTSKKTGKRTTVKPKKAIKPLAQEQPETNLQAAAGDVSAKAKSMASTLGAFSEKATRKAVSLVKLVGFNMKIKEQNNHLQGLYAEVGKLVYEQQQQRGATAKRQPAGMTATIERITEMKKKIASLEREAEELKKTT